MLLLSPIDEPGESDTKEVKSNERDPDQEYRGQVIRGDNRGGEYRSHQHRVSEVLDKETGGHNAEDRKQEYHDGKFEDNPHAHHDGDGQVPILVNSHHGLEVMTKADQERQ